MSTETVDRLLDAAERLFAENGIAATSVRTITAEAGANSAAVHYHFGSRDALVERVFRRRLEPLNAERLELLDRWEATASSRPPDVEGLVRAFVGPTLRLRDRPERGGEVFSKLMGRLFVEAGPLARRIFEVQLAELARRFLDALSRALPHLSQREVFWRAHWLVGAMAHTLACQPRLEMLSGEACGDEDAETILERMVPFLAAGLRAPSAAETGKAS